MTVVKKAVAACRYEQFPEEHVYTSGSTQWVKIEKLYESHRRFRSEFDLYGFFLELRTAKQRDNTSLFECMFLQCRSFGFGAKARHL